MAERCHDRHRGLAAAAPDSRSFDCTTSFNLQHTQPLLDMPFAQLVIGSPGAGKSTYCNGMHQFMSAIGRKCSVVNLDPANDQTSYPAAIDVRDLVTVEEVMEAEELGPNGGMIYAMEELEHNLDWLEEGLKELGGRHFALGSLVQS